MTSTLRAHRSSKKPSSSPHRSTGATDSSGNTRSARTDSLGGFYASGPAVALGGAVQRKVTVGKAGDRYEREADSVADRVDRGQTAPEISRLPPGGLGAAQRMAGDEEPAQSKCDEPEGAAAQTKSDETETEPAQGKEEEPAQSKSEDEPAQSMDEEPAQSKSEDEPAQSKDEEPAQSKSEDEPAQSMEEEPAQSKSEDEPAQGKDEESAQSKSEDEPAQSMDEEPAQSKSEDEPAQGKDEEPAQSKSEDEPAQSMDEEPAQSKSEDEPAQSKDEEPAQEKTTSGSRDQRAEKEAIAGAAIRSRGSGEPLDEGVRGKLEQGMGVDLGAVRVHRDARAQQATKGMKARAFAHKNNIWLGQGESPKDTKLMAHEATHVVQQGGVDRSKPKVPQGGGPPAARSAGARSGALPAVGPAAGGLAAGMPTAAQDAAGVATPTAEAGALATTGDSESADSVAADSASAATTATTASSATEATPASGEAGGDGAAGGSADATDTGSPDAGAAGAAGPGEGGKGEAEKGKQAAAKAGAQAGGSASGRAEGAMTVVGMAGGETPWIDPGAAAAAAKRQAEDRRNRRGVEKKIDGEAKRQEGPAALPGPRRAASVGAAASASAAAPSPANEPMAMGQASHAETLGEQKPGEVKQKTFLEMVEEKLRTMDTPGTVEEMKDFKEDGGAQELKAQTVGGARAQASAAQQDIRGAAETPAQPAAPRQPTDMAPVPPAPEVGAMKARRAAPEPMAREEVSLDGSKEHVEKRMSEEKLSKKRLEKANDPRFSALQGSRDEVHEHSDQAPKQVRAEERSQLAGDRAVMNQSEQATGQSMQGIQRQGQKQVRGDQNASMTKEEAERQGISDAIEEKYQAVEEKVQGKLKWLDGEVDRLFEAGEENARMEFEDYVASEMRSWKLRRYGSRAAIPVIGLVVSAGTWAYDKLRGIDHFPEVQDIFKYGREKYLKGLRTTIVSIAEVVEKELAWCQTEIGKARDDIRCFVAGLPKKLQKVGAETAADVFAKLDDLKDGVEAKKEELVDKLVERYKASREKIDARIEEMRAENRGLVEKFVDKLKAVLEAIDNFRKKLLGILSKARDVIEDILDDPIGFLKNLLKAVKKGFNQFKENIGTHLKKGVFGWLFGTLASAGIQLPKDFSLKSIVGLILQVLGITYDRMKQKLSKLIGPRATAVLEKVTGYLSTLFREGPAGLWKEIKSDLGDLKEFVLGQIKEWLITKIVKAAVTKIVSMFNPAGAIIQAVLTIYNLVMFFVERIDQILQLVKSVVDALAPIVKGQIAQAANAVEKAMGAAVPVIISFLARLLGIGGIAGKIQKIIKKVQRRVDRAIDKALKRIVAKFKGVVGKGKALGKKALAKGKAAAKKLFEWWKIKKKFKQGKESHSVYFKGKGKDAKLMRASEVKPLDQYIQDIENKIKTKEGLPDADRQKYLRWTGLASRLQEKIYKEKTRWSASQGKDVSKYYGPKGGEEISKLMRALAVALSKIPAEFAGPEEEGVLARPTSTPIRYPETQPTTFVDPSDGTSKTSTDGKKAVVETRSVDPGANAGSRAEDNSHLMKAIRKLRGSTVIAGHLINHHLGGPGSEPRNIAPIPPTANAAMKDPEGDGKSMILKENRVIRYEVEMGYGQPTGKTDLDKVLPSSFSAKIEEKVFKPGKKPANLEEEKAAKRDPENWKGKGSPTSYGPTSIGAFTQDPPPPNLGAGAAAVMRALSNKDSTVVELMADSAVSSILTSRQTVADALTALRSDGMVETTGRQAIREIATGGRAFLADETKKTKPIWRILDVIRDKPSRDSTIASAVDRSQSAVRTTISEQGGGLVNSIKGVWSLTDEGRKRIS
ncbi:MAG: DUF4157 domain-containing protein [Thermoanaerobaculia bacterium]|nr:DUF4157 domain-containing protein [Thermoanaerobaculia bacterium]